MIYPYTNVRGNCSVVGTTTKHTWFQLGHTGCACKCLCFNFAELQEVHACYAITGNPTALGFLLPALCQQYFNSEFAFENGHQ